MKDKKQRQSNFELLRILAMLAILAHHYVAKNAYIVDTEISGITANKLFLQFIGNNAFIGNNLFFMISAWFLCEADKAYTVRQNFRKIWKLERQMLFYSIGLYGVTVLARGGGNGCNFRPAIPVPAQHGHLVVPDCVHLLFIHTAIPL